MTTLEMSNDALRAAVRARMDATPADDPKKVGYVSPAVTEPRPRVAKAEVSQQVGSDEYSEWTPPAFVERHRPGTDKFLAVLDEIKDLHLRKTLDYGIDEDALANIRNSADVINVPAYAGCVLRMADKMQRLRSFFRRGEVEFDGVEDTLLDIAAYAAIALVVYRESVK